MGLIGNWCHAFCVVCAGLMDGGRVDEIALVPCLHFSELSSVDAVCVSVHAV